MWFCVWICFWDLWEIYHCRAANMQTCSLWTRLSEWFRYRQVRLWSLSMQLVSHNALSLWPHHKLHQCIVLTKLIYRTDSVPCPSLQTQLPKRTREEERVWHLSMQYVSLTHCTTLSSTCAPCQHILLLESLLCVHHTTLSSSCIRSPTSSSLDPPISKPGRCPSRFMNLVIGEACEGDGDCPGPQKCCRGFRRGACANPAGGNHLPY